MKHHPSIDVIIPTLNEENMLDECLKSIFRQTYPKGKLKVTILDGGSTDSTLDIAKRYGCRIVFNEEKLAEPGYYKGIEKSECDLACVFAADNIIANDKNFFTELVKPFLKRNVTGAFPLIAISKNEPSINKYITYNTEPFSAFIYGKTGHIRTFKEAYRVKYENRSYVIYDFKSNDFPMLTLAQGFIVDRKKFKRNPETKFSDVQPIIDIIKRGEDIAYVKTAAVFHYQVMNLKSFIKKFQWRIKNNLVSPELIRTDDRKDFRVKKFLWVMYSLTLLLPFIHSLYCIAKTKKGFYIHHFIINSVLLFLIPYVFLKVKLGKVSKTYK